MEHDVVEQGGVVAPASRSDRSRCASASPPPAARRRPACRSPAAPPAAAAPRGASRTARVRPRPQRQGDGSGPGDLRQGPPQTRIVSATGPGDLRALADGAAADGGARRLLEHHRRAVAGLQHVAAALAGEDRLGDGDAQAVLRASFRARGAVGKAQALRPRGQRHLLAGWPAGSGRGRGSSCPRTRRRPRRPPCRARSPAGSSTRR